MPCRDPGCFQVPIEGTRVQLHGMLPPLEKPCHGHAQALAACTFQSALTLHLLLLGSKKKAGSASKFGARSVYPSEKLSAKVLALEQTDNHKRS